MPMNLGLGLGLGSKGGGWTYPGSELDLDFVNQRSYNSQSGYSTPSSILTYTSPSPKLVYDANGTLVYAPHNLLTFSETWSNAAWVKVNVTVSGSTIQCGAGGTVHRISQVVSPASVTSRVYYDLKAGTYPYAQIVDGANAANYATFDLSNGTIGAFGANTTATITALGDGFYRCQVEFGRANLPNNTTYLGFAASAVAGYASSFSALGTETIIAARGQLQLLPCLSTDYIPTTSAAVYRLPYDYNPTTHEALGVLIEEQRTNLLTYSEQFDNAAWTKSNATVSANAASAPDGTTTADKLIESASSAYHNLNRALGSTSPQQTLAYSVYAKASERSNIFLRMQESSAANYVDGYFDLSDLSTAVTNGGTGTGATATIQDVGGGWYRCVLVGRPSASTGTGTTPAIALTDTNDNTTYAGDGTSGVYVWGAQLEAGSFPTSYIPTVASQVTRAGDQISILTSAFAYNASTSTLVAAGRPYDATAYQSLASIETDGNNRFQFGRLSTAYWPTSIVSGAVTQASSGAVGTWAALTSKKIAAAFASNDANWAYGGTLGVGDTSVTPPVSPTTLKVGNDQTSRYFNGHVSRVTYFPTRKTDAELQALSA